MTASAFPSRSVQHSIIDSDPRVLDHESLVYPVIYDVQYHAMRLRIACYVDQK